MKSLLILPFLLFFISCVLSDDSGPGTLGAMKAREVICSESNVEHELEALLDTEQFGIPDKDTVAVSWWKDNGYDFLNYKCITIKKRLYMLTVDEDNPGISELSIRSFYSRSRKTWVFATEFSTVDEYRAEKAMDYLLNNISGCK